MATSATVFVCPPAAGLPVLAVGPSACPGASVGLSDCGWSPPQAERRSASRTHAEAGLVLDNLRIAPDSRHGTTAAPPSMLTATWAVAARNPAERQAFSLRNTAVPHQIARPKSTTAQVVPHIRELLPRSPLKVSRTPSTIQRNGMKALTCSNQAGPSVIGSRIPDRSSTGIITMLMTGAITSSLL